jgi:hypothetical protein
LEANIYKNKIITNPISVKEGEKNISPKFPLDELKLIC